MEDMTGWEIVPEEEDAKVQAQLSSDGWEAVPEEAPKAIAEAQVGEPELKYLTRELIEPAQDAEPFSLGDYKNAATAWLEGKELDVRGAINPILKVASAVEKWGESLGLADHKDDVMKMLDSNKQSIADIHTKQNAERKKLGIHSNIPMTRDELAEMVVELLPISKLNTIRGQALGFGAIEGITTYGETGDAKKAKESATEARVITYAGGKAIEKLVPPAFSFIKEVISGKSSPEKSYSFLTKKVGATEKDIQTWNEAYATATGKDISRFTSEDKMLALLNNSENGAILKRQADYFGEDVLAKQAKLEEMFTEMVSKETSAGSYDIPALQLKKYLQDSGSIYGEVEDVLLTHYNNVVKIPSGSIPQLKETLTRSSMTEADNVVIKRILADLDVAAKDGLPVDRLLAMKHDLNSLNLKSTKAYKAGQVGEFIDSQVEAGIGKEGYGIWKEVNQRYAAKSLLEKDNKIAKLLIDYGEGNLNVNVLAKKILGSQQTGYKVFNDIKLALGEKVSSSLEKELIDTAFKTKDNSFEAISKLKDFDFATKEGRGLQGELVRLEGLIPDKAAKELINRSLGLKSADSVGWSDNLVSKAKYYGMGKLWNGIIKRLPSGGEQRAFEAVGDVLKKEGFKAKIDYAKDTKFQEWFLEEEASFRESIKILKAKGQTRTSAENKRLAELTRDADLIAKQLPSKAGERGIIEAGSTDFNRLRNIKETTRPKPDAIEGEIIEETTRGLPEPKGEIIDTTVIQTKQIQNKKEIVDNIDNLKKTLNQNVELKSLNTVRQQRLENLIEINDLAKSPATKASEKRLKELKSKEKVLKKRTRNLWAEAAEVPIGGSEDVSKEAVRLLQKKKTGRNYQRDFSKEDIAELERQFEESLVYDDFGGPLF